MSYSFVWLYLMKCVFTCSIFVNSNTKRFLSVLGVFEKYFVWKIWKFQKSSFALFWRLSRGYVKSRASIASSQVIFGDLFASGRSSREGYSKDFRGSAHDSLAGRPSSREKHLEKFFKFLSSSVLATWTGDFVATQSSREKRVFGKNRGSF